MAPIQGHEDAPGRATGSVAHEKDRRPRGESAPHTRVALIETLRETREDAPGRAAGNVKA